MIIKKVILKNFQKHKSLSLDFNRGINVIEGNTGSGKSNVVRAITWVLYNCGRKKDLRKEGTKKTSATLVLDNNIEITRYVSNSTNGYILKKGEEEKKFDSIGHSIPEEIIKIVGSPIKVNNEEIILNIDKQIAMPFLVGETNGFKAKLFNKLTGSEVIDYILKAINKDKLNSQRKIKDLKERVEKQGEKVKKIEEAKKKLVILLDKLQCLLEEKETYDNLVKIQNLREEEIKLRKKIQKIQKIDIKKIERMSENYEKFLKIKTLFAQLIKLNKFFSIAFKKTEKRLKKVHKIYNNFKKRKELNDTIEKINKIDLNENNKKLEEFQNKYKKALREQGLCPTCNQELDEKTINNLKV